MNRGDAPTSNKEMVEWTTVSRETVLSFGKFGHVEKHHVRLPNGDDIPDWIWISTPCFVNVLVLDKQGLWNLFDQVKYGITLGIGGSTLAPVGGYVDDGELPIAAAQRELQEEMGLVAGQIVPLTPNGVVADCNRGCGKGYLFLALDCEPTGKMVSDDLEEMHRVKLTTTELESSLLAGRFKGMSWAHCVALSLLYIRKMNLE